MNPKYIAKPGETKIEYRKRIIKQLDDEAIERKDALKKGKVKVVMDVDDFGFLLPGYDDLLRLKKSLPNLKITCFTIPLPKEFYNQANAKSFSHEKYKMWAEIVNQQDWIEIAMHGFSHTHYECDCGTDDANMIIDAVEKWFDRVGLNYEKIFKAPYWQYSYDFLTALKERGYVIAIDRNHPRPVPEGSHTYIYNWSFEEPLPPSKIIKGHGHFTGRNTNNISDTLRSILGQLPKETQFQFISEYAKDNNDNVEHNDNKENNGK